VSAPAPDASISPLWFPFLYGIALFPCFGTALLLVFPVGRMRRIWRNRGLPLDTQEARWERLVFHKRVALALSVVLWVGSFVVPLFIGLAMQLVRAA
jgi:hypothetical protein